ncbi:MAG: hypothetical protein WA058_03970 [Minisyncoccia bacterium]
MRKQQFNPKMVPIQISGLQILINPASIDKSNRVVHHGEYKGTKVNSPESCQIDESIVIWAESGKSPVISMSKAAFGVLATQFLESEGHTVTLK